MAEGNRLNPSGPIRSLALFGCPVTQSRSPLIHKLFAAQAKLLIHYEAIEAARGTLAAALKRFAAVGGVGCNVTLPLKGEAAELATSCSATVQLAGAANTLLRRDHGWEAYNTDGTGLVADLEAGRLPLATQRLAVLGAGGATAGVLGALLDRGPREVLIFNRTETAAVELARRHESLGAISGHGLNRLPKAGPFDLVLNATSLGHRGDLPPISAHLFASGGACYDLNYGLAAIPLATWCAEHRIPYRDGLGMLVGQAAESFRIWTGHHPHTLPVLETLRKETAQT